MQDKPAFALFMEMRTGKTATILAEFGELVTRGELNRLLVVAPAGVYRTWEVDAAKHLHPRFRSRVQIERWESKASRQTKNQLKRFVAGNNQPKIFLVNIEALSTVTFVRELVAEFLKKAPTMMVIDESTTIKSHTAARTRFCLTAAPHARRRRILSGLPTPQSPLDIFTQFAFLDPHILGYGTFKPFQYRYAIMKQLPIGPGGRMVQTVAGYQRLDELRAKVKPYAYRVRLDECYDLPPKMYSRRDIELTKEQVRAYAELKAFAVAVLEKTERVTATIVLTQLLRLHQILAGQTKSDDGNVVRLPEHRTAETLSVLEEHTGKAIIWVAYHEDVLKLTEVLTQRYGRGAVARFWGGNADTREAEEKQFLTEPKCRFMIATAASGGRGRTWSVASLMIFYQNTFSLEHRLQSEERAQAVGKINSVGIVDLVARETVEDKILDALRNKRQLSNEMTGDAWKKWVA
jgi:SNF2 family DNA or RNA helicase